MQYPNLNEEKKLWKKGYKRVACSDEAGRGSLSGPVVAAAVTISSKLKTKSAKPQLKIKNLLKKIRDSKKLSSKKREEFYKILTRNPAIRWGTGRVSEKVIDRINILEATRLAMKRAVNNLKKKSDHFFSDRRKSGRNSGLDFLILDGNFKIGSLPHQKSIIKADEKVFSCAATSIIAKVTRDRIMQKLHKKYPQYRFDIHKGYGTKYHRELLKRFGPCLIHRKSFKPVKYLI